MEAILKFKNICDVYEQKRYKIDVIFRIHNKQEFREYLKKVVYEDWYPLNFDYSVDFSYYTKLDIVKYCRAYNIQYNKEKTILQIESLKPYTQFVPLFELTGLEPFHVDNGFIRFRPYILSFDKKLNFISLIRFNLKCKDQRLSYLLRNEKQFCDIIQMCIDTDKPERLLHILLDYQTPCFICNYFIKVDNCVIPDPFTCEFFPEYIPSSYLLGLSYALIYGLREGIIDIRSINRWLSQLQLSSIEVSLVKFGLILFEKDLKPFYNIRGLYENEIRKLL